jgi:hypothetical protein
MKVKNIMLALLTGCLGSTVFASDSLDGKPDPEVQGSKHQGKSGAGAKEVDFHSSPFFAERSSGAKAGGLARQKVNDGQWTAYDSDFLDRPVDIGDEISIVRTSTTKNTVIKTSYDRKGNIISIHAWDRVSGKSLKAGLDLLADPIVKDEIESTVAKLRLVYNAYGEVVSKSAWNKITAEKIAVPPSVPFTNYINEDKYWAYVERQKLYDRSYEDLYVDRGTVRTRRLKKLVRYGNPFGVPQEIEVYEERPIIERHFEDAHYDRDAWVAMFTAQMSGVIDGNGVFANLRKNTSTYLEFGADVHLFRHALEFRFLNLSNSSTIDGRIADFDSNNFPAGSVLDFSLDDYDVTYRKEFIRSERGEFGLNWLFSIKYLDFDIALRNGGTSASLSGGIPLPTLGFEAIKNISDHIDVFGDLKYFTFKNTGLLEFQLGSKYYFHPENVDDWRLSAGLKQYHLEARTDDDSVDLRHIGARFALERAF